MGIGSEINGDLQGVLSNTVLIGAGARINNNIIGVGKMFIGGTNVIFNGNYEKGISNLFIGQGAGLSINGNVNLTKLSVEKDGIIDINGNFYVTEELTMGQNTLLDIGGNFKCEPTTIANIDPTATIIFGGEDDCPVI